MYKALALRLNFVSTPTLADRRWDWVCLVCVNFVARALAAVAVTPRSSVCGAGWIRMPMRLKALAIAMASFGRELMTVDLLEMVKPLVRITSTNWWPASKAI